jgi:flagellar motility protein MotE (MotC chaperone)
LKANKVLIGFLIFIFILGSFGGSLLFLKSSNKEGPLALLQEKLSKTPLIGRFIQPPQTPAEDLVIVSLENEKLMLEKEREAIKIKEDELNKKLAEIERKNKKLSEAEEQMNRLVNELKSQVQNFEQLAKLYDVMNPKKAATIFAEMDDETVINIMLRMGTQQVSDILSNMDSKYAARLTERMNPESS